MLQPDLDLCIPVISQSMLCMQHVHASSAEMSVVLLYPCLTLLAFPASGTEPDYKDCTVCCFVATIPDDTPMAAQVSGLASLMCMCLAKHMLLPPVTAAQEGGHAGASSGPECLHMASGWLATVVLPHVSHHLLHLPATGPSPPSPQPPSPLLHRTCPITHT